MNFFGLSPEEGVRHICKTYGAKLVFVTCESKGCVFKNSSAEGMIPALQGVKVVDTTGAGDIFGGSAMWKLLRLGKSPEVLAEEELLEVARFACTSAGLSTTRPGGISSVPNYDEVIGALKNIQKSNHHSVGRWACRTVIFCLRH